MKVSEIRDLTNDELSKKRDEFGLEMMTLRFQQAKGLMENPSRLKLLRGSIARINTVLRQRQISEKGKGAREA